MFRWAVLIVSVLSVNPANACVIYHDAPSQGDLRALIKLDEKLAKETKLKSQIDASVWGVFLENPSDTLAQKGYSPFKVGGRSKGDAADIIRVVTRQRNVKLGTEIYQLNLRKIDEQRWTDVGVPQHELNWGPEVCVISPDSSRCQLHKLKQKEIKNACHIAILETYLGCLSFNAIPKMCLQYRNEPLKR